MLNQHWFATSNVLGLLASHIFYIYLFLIVKHISFQGCCTDLIGRYMCSCAANFTGRNCEKLSLCQDGRCAAGSRCIIVNNRERCICPNGLQGNTSETNPRLNFGTRSSNVNCLLFAWLDSNFNKICNVIWSRKKRSFAITFSQTLSSSSFLFPQKTCHFFSLPSHSHLLSFPPFPCPIYLSSLVFCV